MTWPWQGEVDESKEFEFLMSCFFGSVTANRVTLDCWNDDDDDDDDDEVTQPDSALRETESKKRTRRQKAHVVRHGKRLHSQGRKVTPWQW